MSNYIATARTNYFKVKNESEFIEWCDEIGVTSFTGEINGEKTYGFYSDDDDSGCFPYWITNYETEEEREVDYVGELSPMLQEGEVAILMEAGAEKCRYVCGWAQAINWKGEEVSISLGNIYNLAREKFEGCNEITVAEY